MRPLSSMFSCAHREGSYYHRPTDGVNGRTVSMYNSTAHVHIVACITAKSSVSMFICARRGRGRRETLYLSM
jgi:hypothetical protein